MKQLFHYLLIQSKKASLCACGGNWSLKAGRRSSSTAGACCSPTVETLASRSSTTQKRISSNIDFISRSSMLKDWGWNSRKWISEITMSACLTREVINITRRSETFSIFWMYSLVHKIRPHNEFIPLSACLCSFSYHLIFIKSLSFRVLLDKLMQIMPFSYHN